MATEDVKTERPEHFTVYCSCEGACPGHVMPDCESLTIAVELVERGNLKPSTPVALVFREDAEETVAQTIIDWIDDNRDPADAYNLAVAIVARLLSETRER